MVRLVLCTLASPTRQNIETFLPLSPPVPSTGSVTSMLSYQCFMNEGRNEGRNTLSAHKNNFLFNPRSFYYSARRPHKTLTVGGSDDNGKALWCFEN